VTPAVQILETVTLACPLAVKCWDEALSQPIWSGLSVIAWPLGAPQLAKAAVPSRTSGAFSFAHMPGMYAYENGGSSPIRPFVVRVTDTEGRFLPCQFQLPVPVDGLGWPACLGASSPPRPSDLMIPMFSAPQRRVPPELAVVRSDLWDAANQQPAAWALVEADIGDQRYRGVANSQGRLLLAFPYPEPPAYIPGSLASPPLLPIDGRTWDVQLSASYQPYVDTPEVPNLCEVLDQPPATLWSDSSLTTTLSSLKFLSGHDLIARSLDAVSRGKLSKLLLTPLASPLDSPI
jgi:hypothetical protein